MTRADPKDKRPVGCLQSEIMLQLFGDSVTNLSKVDIPSGHYAQLPMKVPQPRLAYTLTGIA